MFAAADGVECLDYGCSYLWPYDRPRDSVRVLIESRILLAGGPHGTGIPYYLGASCKGEDTYGVRKQYGPMGFRAGARTLFLDPNYDFTWIVGSGSAVIFRRALPDASNPAGAPGRYREVRADTSRTWGPLRLQLTPATGAYEIPVSDFAAVAAATDAGHGIVAQTEIADAGTGTRAVIEYPVKTMNVSRAGYPRRRRRQRVADRHRSDRRARSVAPPRPAGGLFFPRLHRRRQPPAGRRRLRPGAAHGACPAAR